MEMLIEKGQLQFLVVTAPELVSIVEKQITSFYSEAEVYPVAMPEIWPEGKKLVGYKSTRLMEAEPS